MNNAITKNDVMKAIEQFQKLSKKPVKRLRKEELLEARKRRIPDDAIIISV